VLCASGPVVEGGKKAWGYVRILCKSWLCPVCGPRKAYRLIKGIEEWAKQHDLNRFLTVTLDPKKIPRDIKPEKYLRKVWSKFRVYLGRKLEQKVEFISVMEYHKSGVPHLHALINQYIPQKWISNAWSRLGGGRIVHIKQVADISKMGYYLGKYLTKDAILSGPKGSRRYTTSRGITLNKRYIHSGQLELFDTEKPSTWELMDDHIEQYYAGAAGMVLKEEMDPEDGSIRYFATPGRVEVTGT
jgi:hypothetical protein